MRKHLGATSLGILVLMAALAASYVILVNVRPAQALCNINTGDPSCQPRNCYSPDPANPRGCDKWCGDNHTQHPFEECDTGGPSETCSADCKIIQLPGPQNHLECVDNACQLVDGRGDDLCQSNNECGSDPNAYMDITVTADTDAARWQLFCPPGPYTCNLQGGSGVGPWSPPGKQGDGTVAGKGRYTINPNDRNGQYTVDVQGSANPFERGPRPPSLVSVAWHLVYTPVSTDPSQPAVTVLAPAGSCTEGQYNVRLTWSGTPDPAFGFYAEISDKQNFNGYWRKQVLAATQTDTTSGFTNIWPATGSLQLLPGVTYYARIRGKVGLSSVASWSVPLCTYSQCTGSGATAQCTVFPGTGTSNCSSNADCRGGGPSCTFSATPDRLTIPPASPSANLAWGCGGGGGGGCTIDHGIGPVNPTGGVTVFPTSTITYALSCGGSVTTTTVRVFSFEGGVIREVLP